MDSNTLKLPSSALFLGRRQGRQPATKCCMCHNRVSARSSSNSKNLWGCLCSRVRLELSPDGYWTDRSGVCRRDLFVRPRAFDRGTPGAGATSSPVRSEEHTSELQSPCNLVCRLLLEKKKKIHNKLLNKEYTIYDTPLS